MCDIRFENFQPDQAELTWEDRLRAERTALVETYLTGQRVWPSRFAEDLPQGPLTEQEQDRLDDFSASLGGISMRSVA